MAQRTFSQVLDGFPYPPIERSGVSWTLKGQATFPVLHLPMVKRGRCYSVHEVLPQRTLQDHLLTRHISIYIFHILSLNKLLTCFRWGGFVFYLFVSKTLTTDEELGKAGGRHGCQLCWHEAAHANPGQSSPVLGQPATARVVPRHHHRFHTHDVAVTG